MKINRAAFLALTGTIATSTLAACANDPKSTDAGTQSDGAVAVDMTSSVDMTTSANDAASVSMDAASGASDAANGDAGVLSDASVETGSDAMLPSRGDASLYDFCQANFACEFGTVACEASYNDGLSTETAVGIYDCAADACAVDAGRSEQWDIGSACTFDVLRDAARDSSTTAYCSQLVACDGAGFPVEYCERAFGAVGTATRDAFMLAYAEPTGCMSANDFARDLIWMLTSE